MKKKWLSVMALALAFTLTACGGDNAQKPAEDSQSAIVIDDTDPFDTPDYQPEVTQEAEITPEVEEEVAPEGMYRSELTGEWISVDLKDQRPIAVMVDNEKTALDHYGVNDCDIVYEMVNSTLNGYITRLMCIKKDWVGTEQLGSIRSARPTNFMLAGEYNAILLHDGGPFYIDVYRTQPYSNNISGGFARFSNGKASTYTEYVTYDDYKNPSTGKSYDGLADRIEKAKYTTTYNDYYQGEHFNFSSKELDLSSEKDSIDAERIALPFPHNESKLNYNAETGLYEYSEYGKPHVDAAKDNELTTFKNVIIYKAGMTQYDENGYMVYDIENNWGSGYYITNGHGIPINWVKVGQNGLTEFTNAETGEKITMNVGKTYIALVPKDFWEKLEIGKAE